VGYALLFWRRFDLALEENRGPMHSFSVTYDIVFDYHPKSALGGRNNMAGKPLERIVNIPNN